MPALMVVGTTSHAGKSVLTAVLCRLLHRRGVKVTPFKGQNMALNAYVTRDGLEMGHAQAVQAWAAGLEPHVDMNPILLKPQGNMTSQVVLQGQAVGTLHAAQYYQDFFDRGWQAIVSSLARLQDRFDWIVCEGAGSPAEINLKHRDLTNMRVAKHLQAATVLVADIERGGVFAHLVGTLDLLDPEERALIRGLVINKFRGDISLLASGITWLEERTGIPVLGVIPWLTLPLPAEDSLSLLDRPSRHAQADVTVVVIKVPRIANFTDFDPLEAEPTVNLRFMTLDQPLGQPDAVILPGCKTTLADLQVLHASGMAAQLQAYAAQGGTLLGICGGFQMLGQTVSDLEGVEGESAEVSGLGLLPVFTHMSATKVTRQRQVFTQPLDLWGGAVLPIQGYEIHQGQSTVLNADTPALFTDPSLGIASSTHLILGTYLHDLFHNGAWRRHWLNRLRIPKGLPPLSTDIPDYAVQREEYLDIVTDAIALHLDLTPLLGELA
ncbi:cobyric acid synthase [Synechococcales cyanobacterium C]|uniref:Cobyric acid synthase n=1 Tax=Petrachloros mirabilis ULC683 TaxID=2781853 RepID=A0A8K1ZZX2_9CYAN|nr:cobyric acid synthase [Petrachloros mirabilis]NCJ08400.1 cobyric acid synthase [Petrachloros mirabilis ULC683]